MPTSEPPVTLRERKKQRTRQALAETAVSMFTEHGFDATTLDALVDAVEVSKRTFFRNFRSKEDVAFTAARELWDAYLEALGEAGGTGPLLDVFRDTMLATLGRMDQDWYRRFPATLRLIEQSSSLDGYSRRFCAGVQAEIARRVGDPDRLELRLLVEFFLAIWNCALAEWLPDCVPGELPECVRRAFAAIDDSLRLAR
ncbi:TetR/AcrR family transcriptional regulator [Amycolatopsis minnesotensis]|uniref:HTH tetR-type domain-containing protein n=1 Tax=Amycolatopsis minnesotensis TaxID=337894 RepID=A0ABN2S6Z0_9PSEU